MFVVVSLKQISHLRTLLSVNHFGALCFGNILIEAKHSRQIQWKQLVAIDVSLHFNKGTHSVLLLFVPTTSPLEVRQSLR